MSYVNPNTVLSPKGSIKDLKVIYDGGEDSWSLARMKWDGAPVIAMRWNGGSANGIPSLGNPCSRGYPTWFVIPKEVGDAIEHMLELGSKLAPQTTLSKENL